MKSLFLTLFIISFTLTSFAQTAAYGPIPYKTLEQTIGETYLIVKPTVVYMEATSDITDSRGNRLKIVDAPKKYKLLKADGDKAYLKDSLGADFTDYVLHGRLLDLVLSSDVDAAKKMFLNKQLWLNVKDFFEGQNMASSSGKKITGVRFEPVTVTDVSTGYISDLPIMFTIKTKTGQFGYVKLDISGTNTERNPEYAFSNFFLTEDPKLKYHFTPAVWKMVQAGYTDIGMPMDAFQLVMGSPRDIHSTQTAKGTRQQWVYGNLDHPFYYYFEGGKLVAKQN